MSNAQSNKCHTICCIIILIIFAIISFSIRSHPKDFRTAEINFFHQTQSPYSKHDFISTLFNLTTHTINSKYFQLLELIPVNQTNKSSPQCVTSDKKNSLLLINLNSKTIGLQYFQLIKSLAQSKKIPFQQIQDQQCLCLNFRILILKQKKFLFFDDPITINQYASQIKSIIQAVSSITQNKLDLLTSQEGSAMLMKSLLILAESGKFDTSFKDKINHIFMVNLYNRKTLILRQNVAMFLQQIKRSILNDRKILQIFNSLKLIMINTLRQQYQLINYLQPNSTIIPLTHQFSSQIKNDHQNQFTYRFPQLSRISDNFFVFQKDKHFSFQDSNLMNQLQINGSQQFDSQQFKEMFQFSDQHFLALQKSLIIHSRQMHNIHIEFNHGEYFSYHPFLQLLSHFISQNIDKQISYKATQYFFKYGETNTKVPLDMMSEINSNQCVLYNLDFSQPSLWSTDQKCFRLKVNSAFEQAVHIIYSNNGEFNIFSDSLLKLSEHDITMEKPVFLFEKLTNQILVFNGQTNKIYVATTKVFSPSYPLSQIFSQFQILYKAQIDQNELYEDQIIRKFPVKTCANNLLIFPDNFAPGKYHRQFLLEKSDQKCYKENSSYWKFMQKFFDNAILCRNFIILILFVDFFKNKPFLQYIKITFFCTMILVWYTDLKAIHMMMILFVVTMIENGLKMICKVSSCIQIDRSKVFVCMSVMFITAFICQKFLLQHYDYWKMVLIFVIFFVNEENALVIAVKIYFLQDYIMNGEYDWIEIIQLMWFMRATQNVQENKNKRQILDGKNIWKIMLVLSMSISLVLWPESGIFNTLITCYMKLRTCFYYFKQLK